MNHDILEFSKSTIRQIPKLEFRLYSHHTSIKTKNVYIELMQHFLIMQLVRQNSVCYRFAVAMRSDHEWRLFVKVEATQVAKSTKIIEIDFGKKDHIMQNVHVLNTEVSMIGVVNLRARCAISTLLSASRSLKLSCRAIHLKFQATDDADILKVDRCSWKKNRTYLSLHEIFQSLNWYHCSFYCLFIWSVSTVRRFHWAPPMSRPRGASREKPGFSTNQESSPSQFRRVLSYRLRAMSCGNETDSFYLVEELCYSRPLLEEPLLVQAISEAGKFVGL